MCDCENQARPNEADDEVIQNKDELEGREKIKASRLKQEEEMKELKKMNDSALKSSEENNKKSVATLVKKHANLELLEMKSIKAGICCTCQTSLGSDHLVCAKCSADFCASHSTELTVKSLLFALLRCY